MDITKMETMTGRTMDEVFEAFTRVLDPSAYKAVPGAASLTDISPAFLLEELTAAFGPCGVGWGFSYEPAHLEWDENGSGYMKYNVRVLLLNFEYVLVDDNGNQDIHYIPATGGSSNANWQYAAKGAITNAIGAAASKLLWQVGVYKGEISHTNAAQLSQLNVDDWDELMNDNGIKAVVTQGDKAGYKLTVPNARNNLLEALGIQGKSLNKITKGEGRILFAYLRSLEGLEGKELDAEKLSGKMIAREAVVKKTSWQEIFEAKVVEAAEELGGEKA